jgi:MYXO-CTERM domain-containing protein
MNESLQVGERFLIALPELEVLADAYAFAVVPEPGRGLLAVAAIAALAVLRRRRPA